MQNYKSAKFWRGSLQILIVLIIGTLTSLLLGQWLMFGCLWLECVDSGYFVSQEIQIPREFFPDELVYGTLGQVHESEGAKQHEAQQIFWGNSYSSTALLHIHRYFGSFRAKRGFSTEVRIFGEMFDIPSESGSKLNYQSTSANQFFVGCSTYNCVFVARYGEDLISLNMTIDDQMTIRDFERIVIYLDTIAAKRLGH